MTAFKFDKAGLIQRCGLFFVSSGQRCLGDICKTQMMELFPLNSHIRRNVECFSRCPTELECALELTSKRDDLLDMDGGDIPY